MIDYDKFMRNIDECMEYLDNIRLEVERTTLSSRYGISLDAHIDEVFKGTANANRITNSLSMIGCHTFGDLLKLIQEHGDMYLFRLRNFGKGCYDDVMAVVYNNKEIKDDEKERII